jgi:hypothetical protein
MNDISQSNNARQPATHSSTIPVDREGADPLKSRIVITITGGVAELADAENWPSGLELYIVDYDVNEGDYDEDCADVEGDCSIRCYDTIHRVSNSYAQNVAVEYERLNAL